MDPQKIWQRLAWMNAPRIIETISHGGAAWGEGNRTGKNFQNQH